MGIERKPPLFPAIADPVPLTCSDEVEDGTSSWLMSYPFLASSVPIGGVLASVDTCHVSYLMNGKADDLTREFRLCSELHRSWDLAKPNFRRERQIYC